MVAHFTMVDSRECIGFSNSSSVYGAVHEPMIGTFHPADDFALHVSEGIRQNRRAIIRWIAVYISKAIGTRCKSF
jgi:hypothetical protein